MTPMDHALRLCRRVPVFPCNAMKKPMTKHGFKDAVQEPGAVVDMWRRLPGPLIGVPTGLASGIDLLDIDPRHGGHLWLEECQDALPLTRSHKTLSGGTHFLFRHTPGVHNTESFIAPGVDTRGEGGYMIWWPAQGTDIVHAKVLEDWPRWLLKILIPPKKKAPPPLPVTKIEGDARAILMVARAFDKVRNAAPGQRHYALRAAAATLGGLRRYLPYSDAQVQAQLVGLIMATGARDQRNAERTAQWAMEKGASSPLLERAH